MPRNFLQIRLQPNPNNDCIHPAILAPGVGQNLSL